MFTNCSQFSVDTTLHGNGTAIHFRVRIQPFHVSLSRVELAIPAEKCFSHQIRGQMWKLKLNMVTDFNNQSCFSNNNAEIFINLDEPLF